MKSISLSIQLHLPVIYHKHPFSEIHVIEDYLDYRHTERHVKHLADTRLLPFLKSAGRLADRFGEKFKLAVSVPGISIKLLSKYAPHVLKELKALADNQTIEFFAEPWSNSILPYFVEQELAVQTELHRKSIQTFFGHTPTVFMANSALNPGVFTEFTPFPECKTTFTCSNHFKENQVSSRGKRFTNSPKAQFLINHNLSRKFQHAVSDASHGDASKVIAPFIRYLRKHVSLIRPLVLIFDPLANNITSYHKWEDAIAWLFQNTSNSFYALSDLEEVANYFSIENDYSKEMLTQFILPDSWMKNNMQKEAFKQFKNIYKLIRTGEYPYIPEAWDYLQDINNFFYMSDSFFLEAFANQHFTPFRSPHEAFTSYMNAASNFWNVKNNYPQNLFKTNFLFAPTIN